MAIFLMVNLIHLRMCVPYSSDARTENDVTYRFYDEPIGYGIIAEMTKYCKCESSAIANSDVKKRVCFEN